MLERAVSAGLTVLTLAAFWLAFAGAAAAQTPSRTLDEIPVPVRTIAAGDVIQPADLTAMPTPARRAADTLMVVDDVIGLEARQDLVPGRPILARSVGPVRVIRRNMPVTLVFEAGAVRVEADGLALSDAAAGDVVRVANAKTRQVVTGLVRADGRIWVQ